MRRFLKLILDRYPHESEPDGDVLLPHHAYVGIMVALFGFLFVWPAYPDVGFLLSLVGSLVLLDDVVSHGFGWWTPLDWLWGKYLQRWVR